MGTTADYKLIDLFSGCGGMTRGFVDTGRFRPVFANDFNREAIESYRTNFDPSGEHSVLGDIKALLDNGSCPVPQADVVIGGPPCQGFSLLNKKRLGDPRRSLWFQFMRVVELSSARIVVMENVRQLLTSPECFEIYKTLKNLGFRYVSKRVLNAADYGVPEMRFRTIILAAKDNHISLPQPTHCDPAKAADTEIRSLGMLDLRPWENVRSAIGDLPVPRGTEIRNVPPPLDLHFGRRPRPVSIERYKAVPPGGNRFDLHRNRPDITPDCWANKPTGSTDIFGRLWWDRPSVTIRTEFFKPEKGRYLHPDQHRPITHREAARIQSFPDNFTFSGSKIEIAKQIGNAVPPLLAQALAVEVIRSLEGETDAGYVKETEAVYKRIAEIKLAM
ncbi:DNA (cytosine-5-)-methyltransferase [Geothermobacter hydrogeniphilus]|uniref:Cytosine-specific methyltransferase n=1 Tax=Geothermobacter hydrogeniphilus TaxID=1969733 RepID=A0A2K2HES2_9BACT|nr:DNA cytosine methyltransferase [Geothermobacter hydrogeniphilus]PNU21721.1 DNA (cytosine-5-)-methyltransferase [Geothermobacter hydrogeniphilus]